MHRPGDVTKTTGATPLFGYDCCSVSSSSGRLDPLLKRRPDLASTTGEDGSSGPT